MNSANMKYYEELLRGVVGNFITSLRELKGEVVDLTEWVTFFGYVLVPSFHSTRLIRIV